MNNKNLSKTELEIMKYIWSVNSEVMPKEIRTHFSHKQWSKQAVSTFLKRLVTLGYLNIERLSQMVEGLPICKGCFTGAYPMERPKEDIRGEYAK